MTDETRIPIDPARPRYTTYAPTVCITRRTAVVWGILVSGLASGATGATEPAAGWLGLAAPEWWFGVILGFVVGAFVAYFVPASKQVPA